MRGVGNLVNVNALSLGERCGVTPEFQEKL
jgi:hypothetical protein